VFLGHFISRSDRMALQERFIRFFQGDRTVLQYEREFSHLALYAGHLVGEDSDRTIRFIRGLRDPLRQHLTTMVDLSYATVVDKAKLVEADQEMVARRRNASQKRAARPSASEASLSFPEASTQQQASKRKKKMWWGRKDMRPPPPASTQPQSQLPQLPRTEGGGSSTTHFGPLICHGCRKPGHIRKFCPFVTGAGTSAQAGQASGAPSRQTQHTTPLTHPRLYGLDLGKAKSQTDVIIGMTLFILLIC